MQNCKSIFYTFKKSYNEVKAKISIFKKRLQRSKRQNL